MALTPRDIDVLRSLSVPVYAQGEAFDPTVREICDRLGIKPPTVQKHIDKLVRENAVVRRGYQRKVTKLGRSVLEDQVAA